MTHNQSPDWQAGFAQGQRAARLALAHRLLLAQGQAALSGDFATGAHDQRCTTSQAADVPCRTSPCFCWCHRSYLIPE